MWLRTKTDSELSVLINFDHVTHVFGNDYGALIVLDDEKELGVKDALDEIQTAIYENDRVWETHR